MIFHRTEVEGAVIVDAEPIADHRGHFARVWCAQTFDGQSLSRTWSQANVQFSPRPGTLRGLHYQRPPHEEVKLVRCTRGSVFDVVVDLRPNSATYRKWFGVELRADEYRSCWVPEGCAHGFVTLEAMSEVLYLTSHPFAPDSATGIRYDDPSIGIKWPVEISIISDRDDSWPLLGSR